MLRRYPYWGWLLVSLVLWCINGYQFRVHRKDMMPERMAHAVNNDLKRRVALFDGFVHEEDLIRRMFADSLSENESHRINNFPFFIYCYDRDSLRFWNTNTFIAGCSDSALDKPVMLRNEKGVFVARCIKPPMTNGQQKRLVVLFPVFISYPLENDYLKSHFTASAYIPLKTKILSPGSPAADAYPVRLEDKKVLFYLRFNPHDIQTWVPDSLFIAILIAALIASMSWVQLMIIYLTRKKSWVAGFFITLGLIVVVRVLLYVFDLPFNLENLLFFSPRLYASNQYLSSFGDLFINTMCVLWIVVFLTRHTPYQSYFERVRNKWVRKASATVIVAAMIAYLFLFVSVIRSLIVDSSISFDVSHFYTINLYTILGLLVIGAITSISCMIFYLFNVQLNVLVSSKWMKYFLLAAGGILFLLITSKTADPLYRALVIWILVFVPLLDIPRLRPVSDLLEPHMVFWGIFVCAFCTGILQYFNQIKEKEARKAFVEQKLSPRRDNFMEYSFDKTANNIEQDKLLKSFFYKPSANARKLLTQHFNTQYLTGPINKYQSRLYLFDDKGQDLFNKDTADYATLLDEKNESEPTNSPYLFYKEAIHERHYYYAFIPIYSDTINRKIGYVILDLDLKKQVTETVYPELLQPITNKTNQQYNEYAYAVYVNDNLVAQVNDYPFSTHLVNDTLKDQDYAFYKINAISELHYRVADKRTIVVVHKHSQFLEIITLFSYIFGLEVLIAIIVLLYQLYLSYFTGQLAPGKFIRLTLRKRIHFAMLGVVLISFVILGFVTILFFTDQYRTSNAEKLQTAMQVATQSVQGYLKPELGHNAAYKFDTIAKSNRFRDHITSIANNQKIDINIFDNRGILFSTSQEDIYDKALISRMMRPDAWYQLNNLSKSTVIQNERVAGLSYLSAYEPLRDQHGVTLGYINVPFFSSEKDLNFQISNIVITLINLYAFIFLVSSLITVLITRWITSTFNMIIRQFGMINLQRNERITWPYNDEIGMLVSEYNKMVNKVEENAALLAQSERESAWREMARQVAHEIKNPLTPMKLNIQYLQQAMRNDNPNIKELTDKVSDSIIEQIDNLSYIASEFSNFAKMPEARPEELELEALLNKAAELYMDDALIKVSVSSQASNLFVHSDRSQLLRVLTNLLENAKQAMPAGRQGNIKISLAREDGHAIISIADDGEGMSEEVVKKIFQPYFTTKSSGTGLGLAMTKKIIEFWKGEIWFETKEGSGTTFYVRLPLL